nr:hypothetical protein [Tanacetum cinerariifolium]
NARRGLVHQQHVATENLAVHVFQVAPQVALALAERQAQQTHEDGQVIAAARLHHHGLFDEDFQQLLQAGLVLGPGAAPLQLAVQADAEGPEE